MNTFLNLQIEFKYNRMEMDRQISHMREFPLIERIYRRGNYEQWRAFVGGIKDQQKRVRRMTKNNWQVMFAGN